MFREVRDGIMQSLKQPKGTFWQRLGKSFSAQLLWQETISGDLPEQLMENSSACGWCSFPTQDMKTLQV